MERFPAELEKRDGLLTEFNEEDCIHHNEPAAYVVFYQMAISAKILRLQECLVPDMNIIWLQEYRLSAAGRCNLCKYNRLSDHGADGNCRFLFAKW